jgi:small subunit ribosomal protein S6e
MPCKVIIGGTNGKAWRCEIDPETLSGKQVGETIEGSVVHTGLAGYQLLITGGSDAAGFPLKQDIEGIGLKRVLLTKGWGMRDGHQGIRRRKTVRGKQLSPTLAQLNLKVTKTGAIALVDVFADQNKPVEVKPVEKAAAAPVA